jgi:hypothetical protein
VEKATRVPSHQGTDRANLEIGRRKFGSFLHIWSNGYNDIRSTALTWKPQGNRKTERPKNSRRRTVEKEYDKSWERYEKEYTK